MSKLTAKMERFAEAVASGEADNLSAAYRLAYDADGMAPGSIHREACLLAARPKIAQRINALKERYEQQKADSLAAQSVSDRERVLTRLRQLIDTAEPSDSGKLRAIELLGKASGVFTERIEHVSERSALDIEQELERRLAEIDPEPDQPDTDKLIH